LYAVDEILHEQGCIEPGAGFCEESQYAFGTQVVEDCWKRDLVLLPQRRRFIAKDSAAFICRKDLDPCAAVA